MSCSGVNSCPSTASNASGNDYRYQPARPLDRITLQEFKTLDDNYGDDPVGSTLAGSDPILGRYDEELGLITDAAFFVTPLDQLLATHPFPAQPATPGAAKTS